ncbi:hypothetical protein ACWCQZ_38215 [Streptomyces sp. NPDC002285]
MTIIADASVTVVQTRPPLPRPHPPQSVDHYRLARVRREEAFDYTDESALAHLARLIGAAA